MARDEAVAKLPLVYQRVMALLDEGRSPDEIAETLGVDSEAVPTLIELATAKLKRNS
jgi:DNA-directed RNA polymerase specialized sigma24 family protein